MKQSIGSRIRIIRLLKGHSQEFIAEKLGITQKTYSFYESGKKHIPKESLRRIADIFQMELASILYFSPELILRSITSPFAQLHEDNPELVPMLKKLQAQKQEEIAYYKMRLDMMEKQIFIY